MQSLQARLKVINMLEMANDRKNHYDMLQSKPFGGVWYTKRIGTVFVEIYRLMMKWGSLQLSQH